MKSIKKGGEKLKRPMKIRVIALVMAFVMVTSVLVITNRNGKVEAVSEMVSETTYLSGMALKDGDAYSVHVPCDNIKFTLPAIPGQSTVSEDTVVYTNDEENAWSLTATDDLKVEHQVKKSVTTNYEWTGDVASEEGAFTITSSESGSKVATVRKTVTTTYTDNDTVIADLTGSPAVENTDAYTIITDAPAGISIDEVTGVISDADSGKSDSDIVFYYGDSRYSIGDDTTLLTKSEADNKLAGFDDGNYQVTKYIVGEYSSEGKTLWTASSTYSYTKNAVLVEGITISEDGNPQHKTEKAQYEEAVNFSGVNPNNDVIISIKTDDINAKVTVDPAMTVNHSEHNNTFTVPGDIGKNDTYEPYAVTVKDSLGKVQKINFAIYYGNGTPSISADVITGASEVDGVNYVSGNSDTLEFSATAEAPDAQIVDANVEISKNSDMSNPTSTKSANVSGGSISAEITKSDLNEGDNYIRVSAKSDYGITTKSSTTLKLVMDSKNPVLSNPVLSQGGSNIADDATITCAKDAEITLDLSDAAPSSGIDKVVVNRAISEGGDSPVSEAPEISGSKVTLKIPAKTDDSGKSYIYKFKAYDKAGNESAEVTKNVKFDNDASLKITRKVLPSMKNAFAVWEGTKVAVIDYEVTSDVEINENATITIDGEDKSASAEFVKDGFMHYTYTINYSQSKTINNIVFTVKNKNGFSVSDTLEVLHIDVADPQDNGISGDNKWQKSFFLSGTVSDPQDGDADAVSGLSSAKYSISNSKADVSAKDISISEGKGVVNIEVPESKTTEGTKIKFDLADKANNTYSNTYTYYIDNTPPKADLSISGKDLSSLDDYYLKNDPVIKYSGSDALSGLADTNGIVFRINGTEYKNVSGKKLSDIVGGTSDTTEYNVELVVTDKAGNSTVQKTVFMVDISKPDITVTKSIDGKYTNSNVTVKIQVKESNLKDYVIKRNDKEVNVKLTKKGDEYVGSFVVDKKNYGNNKVTVEVTDASGNTSEGSTSFVIDTKAPKVTTQISKDGNTWYDFNVDEPLDEFLQFYPYVRVKVKDDYEDPDSETVEMTYTPFNDSEGYTDTVTGKKYRLSSSKGNEEGQYEFDFAVKDKAGNKGINVTGDYTEEEAITDLRMCFSVDKTAPKHNLYITTPNPANFDKFNNTYKNVVRKFKDKKD
ncbi:MAG: Ig-like domain repeat protein, partial [Eubacterium sp.]|nr:Ig-like domain repeat protein [Eubacterium sp.]